MKFKTFRRGVLKLMMIDALFDEEIERFLVGHAPAWAAKLAAIDGVYVHVGERVTRFPGFDALPNLKLVWGAAGRLQSLSGLEHCKQLQQLVVSELPIRDFVPLRDLDTIDRLRARGLKELTSLEALAGLKRLRVLDLSGSRIPTLAPLAHLTQIEALSLRGCDLTTVSVECLVRLPRLRHVSHDDLRDVPGGETLVGELRQRNAAALPVEASLLDFKPYDLLSPSPNEARRRERSRLAETS